MHARSFGSCHQAVWECACCNIVHVVGVYYYISYAHARSKPNCLTLVIVRSLATAKLWWEQPHGYVLSQSFVRSLTRISEREMCPCGISHSKIIFISPLAAHSSRGTFLPMLNSWILEKNLLALHAWMQIEERTKKKRRTSLAAAAA